MKDSVSMSLPEVLKRKLDKLTKQEQFNRIEVSTTQSGLPR